MGGLGSGRSTWPDAKATTDASWPLDIRQVQRAGLLVPGYRAGWKWSVGDKKVAGIHLVVEADRAWLVYRHRRGEQDAWQDVTQSVRIEYTPCHFGGSRPWWRCPACDRRAAVLYGRGGLFACRHCHDLAYPSQREAPDDRAARQANKIRERLGWAPGILNPNLGKPKGMHWATYRRLKYLHDGYKGKVLVELAERMGLMVER